MKRFISFSGGVESTTMCLLYGKGATAIWCDTGAEHEEMYKRIDYVEEMLTAYHNGDFKLIRIKPNAKYKGEYYDSLEKLIVAYKYMPSPTARYCTRQFKIEPIDNFLKAQGACELLIGFNADEEGREGNLEKMQNVMYRYPLIEDGHNREDCEQLLRQYGLHPDFPVYMLRGGCRECPYKSEKEYKAMYFLNPEEFEHVMVNVEEAIQDRRKKFYSIIGNGKSLRQLKEECEREKEFLKIDFQDIYKSYKTGKSCGAYCNR